MTIFADKYNMMRNLNKVFSVVLFLSFCLTSVAKTISNNDIVVLFDNDVHGHMAGYSKMAALRQTMLHATPDVCLVSLGDFAQGGRLCTVSHGQYAIDIMNRVGYDFITLGNHEFDYGLEQLDHLTSNLKATSLLCNFKDVKTGETPFQPFAIRQFGKHKVAFIGCVTPITKISDSPHSFVDKDGNDIYTFCPDNFFDVIQQNVDKVRSMGADIVVLLAHLGDIENNYATSEETIRKTKGINVVLDGHAHNVIEARKICNQNGDSIILCSTGYGFANIGCLKIDEEGNCETDLISTNDLPKEDEDINQLLASFESAFNRLPVIGETKYDLVGFDKEHNTYDRNCQTNLGTLCADAFRVMTRADIGWMNAGGVRGSIPAGKITFKELLDVFPFENRIYVAEYSGQQILDALEYGVHRAPADNGSYPQVSGIIYEIDLSVKSNILSLPTEPFAGIGEGPRRIKNAQILNKDSQQYEPIDPSKTYSIASIDYIIKNRGCNGILDNGKIVADNQMIDIQLIEDYLNSYLHGMVTDNYNFIKQ